MHRTAPPSRLISIKNLRWTPVWGLLLAALPSCGAGGTDSQGSGGTAAPSGGAPGGGTGGASGSGGSSPATGGAHSGGSLTGSGGSTASGGGPAGGAAGVTGGANNAGGAEASGGQVGSGGGGALPAVVDCPETYQNPIVWEDLPDVEVIRVGEIFYYTASTFHQSPGAPVLRSFDLVNWEYVGHSVPALDFDDSYDLSGDRAYVSGIWASTLQYRESNETFYWMGCMRVGGGYAFTSKSPTGPWEKHKTQGCYYDMGLLVDDDDKMYVASGNNSINVAELSADGFSQVRSQKVYDTPSSVGGPLEGARFKKIDGRYYIFLTQYANGEYVLRADDPFGPYEMKPFAVRLPYGGKAGSGSSPHQGGLVETAKGDWYYMGFNDSFPSGRIPVMAPVVWQDGWPTVTLVNNQWGGTYPFPDVTCRDIAGIPTTDTFSDETLRHEWEWNHNPDNSKWSSGDGLTLETVTVTDDLYDARNTLTRRIPGPVSTGTIELDYSTMKDGDVAGLAALRDVSAWIGVKRASGSYRVVMTNGVNLTAGQWTTSSIGAEVAGAAISGGKIWLRVEANVRSDSGGANARFSYSADGTTFTPLGNTLNLTKDWQYFLGYRFGIFNYATQSLGGSVKVPSFTVSTQ